MSDRTRPTAVARVLSALGLARAAEVDHERRVARSIRESERGRARRQAAEAAARLRALEEKLQRAHEQYRAEHAARAAALERLRAFRERLTVTEAALADSLASERRLKSIYDSHEERLLAQLRIGAARVRERAPADDDEARQLERSSGYAEAAAAWRAGRRPAGLRCTTTAGVRWSIPADSTEVGSLARRILDGWLPLDDLAIIRQFAVGGVMLDIGANVGTTSIPRAVLGDFARVYGAEPNGDNFLCLVGNVLDNHLAGRVLPDRVAISSSGGTARLRRSHKIGGHQLVQPGAPAPADFEEVPCVTLDAWIERLHIPARDVRFVKVDTQGWDLHVLQGAAALLQRRDIVWQIEASPGLMKNAGSTVADLAALAAARFTHVKELGGHTGGRWRPAAELPAILEALPEDRRFANLLLFNLE